MPNCSRRFDGDRFQLWSDSSSTHENDMSTSTFTTLYIGA